MWARANYGNLKKTNGNTIRLYWSALKLKTNLNIFTKRFYFTEKPQEGSLFKIESGSVIKKSNYYYIMCSI